MHQQMLAAVPPLPRTRGGISGLPITRDIWDFSSPHTRGYFLVCLSSYLLDLLFPAHAGVFPSANIPARPVTTLPRTRGGISLRVLIVAPIIVSSPHTRGYFHFAYIEIEESALFPAHAGVFRHKLRSYNVSAALPRTRGGISYIRRAGLSRTLSSPHTRGYFRATPRQPLKNPLFPAHAGVFPALVRAAELMAPLPRTRGGISLEERTLTARAVSSPHTRGYFRLGDAHTQDTSLFPAHAGVFPKITEVSVSVSTLPRTRGGISVADLCSAHNVASSPHTRGYFRGRKRGHYSKVLFPAHAGVFPRLCTGTPSCGTLPRTRGGISNYTSCRRRRTPSSPHTRGYFRMGIVPM